MRLLLQSKGDFVEVGSLLVLEERHLLAETLRSELQKLKGAT